jgi:RNA polymerase sigma factor (sigma-70 family)
MNEIAPNETLRATTVEGYTELYKEHYARFVAHAHALTGNSWQAEDLVAEAHYQVWRRISRGATIENVPAYVTATIRNLAVRSSRAPAEVLRYRGNEMSGAEYGTHSDDSPEQHVARVDLLARMLRQLPSRWVMALWLAEVEDLPLDAVGRSIGTNANATGALLSRAREGLRQAFLRGQPGTPASADCDKQWQRMPAFVRGAMPPRQARSLEIHSVECGDCRERL